MASMTVSKLAVPTFVGLKAGEVAKPSCSSARASVQPRSSLVCVSSMNKLASNAGKLMLGASAGVLLGASAAFAADTGIGMGTPDGNLIFSPSEVTVAPGDTVTFTNVGGFPHNIIFDDYDSLSHEDLLNAPGETYTITLKDKGTYEFYCEPHQGVGMKGKITVS